jgi:hypothetical protein
LRAGARPERCCSAGEAGALVEADEGGRISESLRGGVFAGARGAHLLVEGPRLALADALDGRGAFLPGGIN